MNQEPDDFRDLFRQWVDPLLELAGAYAYSIVRNHADAEDAVQDSLWKAYRGLKGYDRARPFKGWWFAIIRNCCLDMLEQRRARPRNLPVELAHDVVAQAAESLLEALDALTPPHREILKMRYFGGCSYRELAEGLGIPEGTVMSRLHAARLALAASYRED